MAIEKPSYGRPRRTGTYVMLDRCDHCSYALDYLFNEEFTGVTPISISD